jgi:hypothetical protein
LGWQLQREINKCLTIGAELFYETPSELDGERHFGFNAGAIINLTKNHHILMSAGTDIEGPSDFYYYVAYQLTFGPEREKSPAEVH